MNSRYNFRFIMEIKTFEELYYETHENYFKQKIIKPYIIKSYFYKESKGLEQSSESLNSFDYSHLNSFDDCNIFQKKFYESLKPKVSEQSPKVLNEPNEIWFLWKKEAYTLDETFILNPSVLSKFCNPKNLYKTIVYSKDTRIPIPIISTTFSGFGTYQIVEYDSCGFRKIKRWYDEKQINTQLCIYNYIILEGQKYLQNEDIYKFSEVTFPKQNSFVLRLRNIYEPKTQRLIRSIYYDENSEIMKEL